METLQRIEQRVTKMEQQHQQQSEVADALKAINDQLASINQRLDKAEEDNSAEAQERRRSIVLIGLREQRHEKASERVQADKELVTDMLDMLDVSAPFTCYRLGRPREGGNGRLMKVIFPASVFVGITLGSWKRNRSMMRQQDEWHKLLIRPSLDKAALDADRERRKAKWLQMNGDGGNKSNEENVTQRNTKK